MPIIINADCLQHLRTLPDSSIDAIITDPPYGLSNTDPKRVTEAIVRWTTGDRDYVPAGAGGFMGAAWDDFVPPPAVWDECLRVLKPGGHLAAFSGGRTQDLMGLSIRLAGFDIRDSLAWMYGSGMPRGQEIGRAYRKAGDQEAAATWDGWNTSLKPAHEPIILARKPLAEKSALANLTVHGTGAMNTGACRIAHRNAADYAESVSKNQHGKYGTAQGGNSIYGDYTMLGTRDDYDGSKGRFPANVILSHTTDCTEPAAVGADWMCAPGCQIAVLDGQSGLDRSVGGASRFFYCAKAGPKERPTYITADGKKILHTTVKPLAVMQWLVRLLTPAGGTVLDPFAGSGTTIEAAVLEGVDVIGIERETGYLPLIQQRIDRAAPTPPTATAGQAAA